MGHLANYFLIVGLLLIPFVGFGQDDDKPDDIRGTKIVRSDTARLIGMWAENTSSDAYAKAGMILLNAADDTVWLQQNVDGALEVITSDIFEGFEVHDVNIVTWLSVISGNVRIGDMNDQTTGAYIQVRDSDSTIYLNGPTTNGALLSVGTSVNVAASGDSISFFGVNPVAQPATISDPSGGGTQDAEARTAINALIDRLQELGLIQ